MELTDDFEVSDQYFSIFLYTLHENASWVIDIYED